MRMRRVREFFQARSLSFRLLFLTVPVTIMAISLLGYLDDRVGAECSTTT